MEYNATDKNRTIADKEKSTSIKQKKEDVKTISKIISEIEPYSYNDDHYYKNALSEAINEKYEHIS